MICPDDRLSQIAALRPRTGSVESGRRKDAPADAAGLAALLGGGIVHNRCGSHLSVRRVFDRPQRETLSPDAWRLIDGGAGDRILDPGQWLFLDTETTGLSGGTGTHAFLVGIAWWEDDRFVVEQSFLRDYGDELSLLCALSERLAERRVMVTFNGKSFDWPLLQTRYRMSRVTAVPEPEVHLDLLHPARRLWRFQLNSVSLTELERCILGLGRDGDIPSASIPQRYFDFIRGGVPDPIAEVFDHNQMDLCGLAALAMHMNRLLQNPEQSGCGGSELFGISRLLQRSGAHREAGRLYRKSLEKGLPWEARRLAERELALMAKRDGDFALSNEFWERLRGGSGEGLKAYEQLAICYEHRDLQPGKAMRITKEALVKLQESFQEGRIPATRYRKWHARLEHRLARLERKCSAAR